MTDQGVNVTNYTHRNARERERAHTNITYGVGKYFLQQRGLKNVMSGYKIYTCQLSGCDNKNILKIIMCV